MNVAVRKPRPRRIAADEAHSWARNLRLKNPYGKLVLSMLTIYVNGEGSCFVSANALAEDCELALETVRRRLAWLEGIGAIARFPQWIDEHGRRNGAGKGRRTTDDIRLMIDADPELIEAKAAGEADSVDHAADPLPEGGANDDEESTSPPATPSLRRGPDSLEPEPEKIPPNPPSGGGQVVDLELEVDIEEFAKNYPAPITNLPRLRTVLSAMTRDERRKVLLAEKGYASFIAECERKGRSRAVKDAHRWVADGSWQGYLATGERAEAHARMQQVPVDSPEGKALIVLHRIAGMSRPFETGGRFLLTEPMTPAVLALADAPDESAWLFVPAEDRNRCGAWDGFVGRALHGKNRPALVNNRNPGGKAGFMAPYDWPPRKDGSLCDTAA